MVDIDKDVMVDGYFLGLVEETKRMNGLDVTSTCFKYPKSHVVLTFMTWGPIFVVFFLGFVCFFFCFFCFYRSIKCPIAIANTKGK